MPIYEFKCLKCGHVFEIIQTVYKVVGHICPECGSIHTEKQISKDTGFILKGKGWFRDGYTK